ncbi:MAG TPA: acetyl-CoA carboxylase biotin carboxylase subunit [Solirubrobacterales bacterium]|jgi:acetyl-CoA carboxylase biotin carboxylase subunit
MSGEIGRLLVANRGEIAVRVIRACRDLGISPVAVYSDADSEALHVQLADEAVHIGPAHARKSYLLPEAIVAAALEAGAQAIHPGYGFLSEDPRLPRACEEAGLVFVGPPAEVMAAVGDKVLAREAAIAAGVAVVPGSEGRLASVTDAQGVAAELGFPVLLKASAGGGGRGIRPVESAEELADAYQRASAEAEAAFGDGGLFLEKLLVRPRHVEVQVLADAHGNVVHLGERDCSTQRRKQKLIEEAPAPNLDPAVRDELCEGAVRFARGVGYVGAGTCEFLVDAEGRACFIEMNARIQVEHGITELVTGVDLVAEQLRIAAGRPLGLSQGEIEPRGAAIEFRINAEDPGNGFMPSPGEITAWRPASGPGVRVDSGVEAGGVVQPFYDSMVAKLMVWGASREEAMDRARRALEECRIEGVTTTLALHRELLDWEPLRAGEVTIESLEEHLDAAAALAGA